MLCFQNFVSLSSKFHFLQDCLIKLWFHLIYTLAWLQSNHPETTKVMIVFCEEVIWLAFVQVNVDWENKLTSLQETIAELPKDVLLKFVYFTIVSSECVMRPQSMGEQVMLYWDQNPSLHWIFTWSFVLLWCPSSQERWRIVWSLNWVWFRWAMPGDEGGEGHHWGLPWHDPWAEMTQPIAFHDHLIPRNI